jgi:aquaporin Z
MDTLKLIVEFIGTFFFLSIILNTLTLSTAEKSIGPISVAVGLLAAIYFGGKVSGGHFNPAVSVAMYLKQNITLNLLVGYIVAQLLGAGVAVKYSTLVH